MDQASARYDTDYWHNSFKQGLQFLENQTSNRKMRITSLNPRMIHMADPNLFEVVEFSDHVDFYLSTTRFDQHKFLPGEIVHTVQAGQTNLLYIVRPDSSFLNDPFFLEAPFKYFYVGTLYNNARDTEKTIGAYQTALKQGVSTLLTPRRLESLYVDLASLMLTQGRQSEAVDTLKRAVDVDATFARAWFMMEQIKKGKVRR